MLIPSLFVQLFRSVQFQITLFSASGTDPARPCLIRRFSIRPGTSGFNPSFVSFRLYFVRRMLRFESDASSAIFYVRCTWLTSHELKAPLRVFCLLLIIACRELLSVVRPTNFRAAPDKYTYHDNIERAQLAYKFLQNFLKIWPVFLSLGNFIYFATYYKSYDFYKNLSTKFLAIQGLQNVDKIKHFTTNFDESKRLLRNSVFSTNVLQIVKKPTNFGRMWYLHLKDSYNQGRSQTDILGWKTCKLKTVTR